MSEDVIKSLNDQIHRLMQELSVANADARKRRIAVRDLKSEMESLRKEHESVLVEYKTLKERSEAAPSELEKQLTDLKAQIKVRDVRDKFREVEAQLGEKVTLDRLFKYNDFDPAAADPESLDVKSLVDGWRDAAPGLFRPNGREATTGPGGSKGPALATELPNGRGAPDNAGTKFHVRRADLGDPAWMQRNQARFASASADGNVVLID